MSAERYGIAEWFGVPYERLTRAEKVAFSKTKLKVRPCPFVAGLRCNKSGGVCTFRKYRRDMDDEVHASDASPLVSLCPNRFFESNEIYSWIGSELIGTDSPKVATEIPFLVGERRGETGEQKFDAVGRIDAVLVNNSTDPVEWCALEIQAVYFSGPSMKGEFEHIRKEGDDSLHWPQKIRRPDFRSSGPKRLMPQLQIKVPTISRWGKKMAVVVDRAFFESLGSMSEFDHNSNADIIWFVVDFVPNGLTITIKLHKIARTTLDRAVEGLTGGHPVSKSEFESALSKKLSK